MQGKLKASVGAIRNENGNININAKDKAESFNHFFYTVGKKLADAIIPDNSLNIFHHIYQVSPITESLNINSQKIKRAFDKYVRPGKGSGPDNLSARGLKLGGDAVAVSLSYVMEESLRTVPTIVISHTFCASPDTRISYRQCLLKQGYFRAI